MKIDDLTQKEKFKLLARSYLDNRGVSPSKSNMDSFRNHEVFGPQHRWGTRKSGEILKGSESNFIEEVSKLNLFPELSDKQLYSYLKALQNSDFAFEEALIRRATKPKCRKFNNGMCELGKVDNNLNKTCPHKGLKVFEECERHRFPWHWGKCFVFIDLDNTVLSLKAINRRLRFDRLLPSIVNQGALLDKKSIKGRAYGESSLSHDNKESIKKEGIKYKDCSLDIVTKKNRADMHITVDAMEMLYEKRDSFDTAIFMTGDADFVPLIEKMVSKKVNVIVYSTRVSLASELKSSSCISRLLENVDGLTKRIPRSHRDISVKKH